MRMQRVELSIRQFPPSSFLSCFLFSQFPLIHIAGHICSHFHSSAFVSLVTQLIHWTAAPLCTVFPIFFMDYHPFCQQCNRGCLQTRACTPFWEWWGGGVGGDPDLEPGLLCCPTKPRDKGQTCKSCGGVGSGVAGRGGRSKRRVERLRRRMVMPAPRALVVLLLRRLRVIQAQSCLSST